MLEREAMAVLVSAKGVGYAARAAALQKAESAKDILADPAAFQRELSETGVLAVRRAMQHAEAILDEIYASGTHLLLPGEEGYPKRLRQIPRAPHLLFVQGAATLDDELSVSIVGTRAASEYGLRHTRRIAQELAKSGVCIVSGLALGVDAAAHEGALSANGRTIAVLGGALDKFYPEENRALRDRILEAGGSVVSEYPMGVAPNRYSFLLRNRIIAGLSQGTLVTEGPLRSGALRTASDAGDYGREVFALPGSVDAPNSALPHKLLADGAHLATNGADILCILAPQLGQEIAALRREETTRTKKAAIRKEEPQVHEEKSAPAIPEDLPSEERAVLMALVDGEKDFDALCEETGMDGAALGTVLMGLEMEGLITSLPGLRYAREA